MVEHGAAIFISPLFIEMNDFYLRTDHSGLLMCRCIHIWVREKKKFKKIYISMKKQHHFYDPYGLTFVAFTSFCSVIVNLFIYFVKNVYILFSSASFKCVDPPIEWSKCNGLRFQLLMTTSFSIIKWSIYKYRFFLFSCSFRKFIHCHKIVKISNVQLMRSKQKWHSSSCNTSQILASITHMSQISTILINIVNFFSRSYFKPLINVFEWRCIHLPYYFQPMGL